MSHFQKRIKLLKNPPFFAYMFGFLFAAFGNGLGYVATSWIVVSHDARVSSMAILMACFWAPNILLGPIMGVFADRLSRKWMITLSHIARAVIFLFFSFYIIHHINVTTLYVMTLCSGIAFSAFYSSAFAFMRDLVPEKQMMYANSIVDMTYEVGNTVGMGCAGLLIALTSAETAIFINGITFIIATVTMFFIPQSALHHAGKRIQQPIKIFHDFHDGLYYLWTQKKLLAIYIIQLLIFVTFLTSPLLLAPFSKIILNASVGQFGMIEAAMSVGIVIGGIFMPWIAEKTGLLRTLLFFCYALGIVFFIFGFNRSIHAAIVLYFVIGFAGAIWPLVITKAQSLTCIDFQGRVQATLNSLSGITMLFFYFSVGAMGRWFGVNHLYFIEVLITAMAIIFLMRAKEVFV